MEVCSVDVKEKLPLMPILPMLAENCRSLELAISSHPDGFYCEMDYEAERILIHKKGREFKYYNTNTINPKLIKKLNNLKQLISIALPYAKELILDCFILPVDSKTSKPILSNTVECHQNDDISLLIIDCIYYDGDLTSKPLIERKEILKNNIVKIPYIIMLAESKEIHNIDDLNEVVDKMITLGFNSVILKDVNGIYEPGKSRWLKVDHNCLLSEGRSLNLLLLGGWYDKNKKIAKLLMGCCSEDHKSFYTVTTVYISAKMTQQIKDAAMIKIKGDFSALPDWLQCDKNVVPDVIAKKPEYQPVFEILYREFIRDATHTANCISLRFPYVVNKKNCKNLNEVITLNALIKLSQNDTVTTETNNKEDNIKNTKNENYKHVNEENAKNESGQSKKRKNSGVINSTEKEIKKENTSIEISKDIKSPTKGLNYFQNIYLLLEDQVKGRYVELIRNFIAHGGTVVHEYHKEYATHVLHLNDECPEDQMPDEKDAAHIIIEWIEDTLEKGILQDDRPYRVRLTSNKKAPDDF